MTTCPDFADAWRRSLDRIRYIRDEWEIWHVRDASEKKKPQGMTAFDLVPPWEQTKLVCMIAAGSDPIIFRELYTETPLVDVWEMLALQKASRWTPPPPREPGK